MSNTNNKLMFKRFVNFLGFLATCLIAISLLVQVILNACGVKAGFGELRLVGEILAYIITLIAGFNYVKTKRNVVFIICYAICATAIVILLIFRPW